MQRTWTPLEIARCSGGPSSACTAKCWARQTWCQEPTPSTRFSVATVNRSEQQCVAEFRSADCHIIELVVSLRWQCVLEIPWIGKLPMASGCAFWSPTLPEPHCDCHGLSDLHILRLTRNGTKWKPKDPQFSGESLWQPCIQCSLQCDVVGCTSIQVLVVKAGRLVISCDWDQTTLKFFPRGWLNPTVNVADCTCLHCTALVSRKTCTTFYLWASFNLANLNQFSRLWGSLGWWFAVQTFDATSGWNRLKLATMKFMFRAVQLLYLESQNLIRFG